MNKRTAWKPLTAAFALGWCLLFLHCETTEKSKKQQHPNAVVLLFSLFVRKGVRR